MLSQRQRQVFDLLLAGHRPKEIGAQLAISEKTVDGHKVQLMSKLGVSNMVDLVKVGILLGLTPAEPSSLNPQLMAQTAYDTPPSLLSD